MGGNSLNIPCGTVVGRHLGFLHSLYELHPEQRLSVNGVQLTTPTSNKPSWAAGVAYLFTLLVVLSLFFHIYYIDSSADEDLLWNPNEVYLFMHGEHRGYHVSYLGYSAEIAKSFFGVMDDSDDTKPYTVIIRITRSGVERFEETRIFDFFTPHGADLYAWNENLWKWAGTHFERASSEEEQKFGTRPSLPKKQFADVDGWSGDSPSASKTKLQPPTQVGGVQMTFDIRNGELYVDVSGHHHPPQKLYYPYLDGAQHVSKSEYLRVFGRD